MTAPDIQRAHRETVRWTILQALDSGRPYEVAETLILSALQAVPLRVTAHELREELDYLEQRDLVEIGNKDDATWLIRLSRHGIDLVEYTMPCEPGIARPKKYW